MHWQGAGRTATADAGSCTSPNSPRRRSPRRSACTAPSFAAICNRPATYAAAGIPPILRWRALLRWLSGNGDRHPTRCMRLRPGTLHPGASPHFSSAIASRGGGRILERKEDLRPAGRWIRPPTEVVNSICNLTQFNAIQCNFTKMPAILRRLTKTNANSRKFQHDRGIAVERLRKPLCELDLHRRICSFFLGENGSSGFRCSRRLGFSPTSLKPRPRRAKAHPTIHRDPHLSPEEPRESKVPRAVVVAFLAARGIQWRSR